VIPYGKRHPVVLIWVSIKNLTLLFKAYLGLLTSLTASVKLQMPRTSSSAICYYRKCWGRIGAIESIVRGMTAVKPLVSVAVLKGQRLVFTALRQSYKTSSVVMIKTDYTSYLLKLNRFKTKPKPILLLFNRNTNVLFSP